MTLVAAQVALSFVLLVAAGLFAGTLRNLHAVDKGFNADGLLLFRVQPQLNGYAPPRDRRALHAHDRAHRGHSRRAAPQRVSRHPLLGLSRRADGVASKASPDRRTPAPR